MELLPWNSFGDWNEGTDSSKPGQEHQEPGGEIEQRPEQREQESKDQELGRNGQESGRMDQEPGRMDQELGRMDQEPVRMDQEPGRIDQDLMTAQLETLSKSTLTDETEACPKASVNSSIEEINTGTTETGAVKKKYVREGVKNTLCRHVGKRGVDLLSPNASEKFSYFF